MNRPPHDVHIADEANWSSHGDDASQLTRGDFSRSWVGRVSYLIFHYRKILLAIGIAITLALGWSASRLKADASFEKTIPLHHAYMGTFLKYEPVFGGANKIVIALHNRDGDIFTTDFMTVLRSVSEDVFFTKGVDRTSLRSLFSSDVRYNEVVEDGFRGGSIVDSNFSGAPEQLQQVRTNLLKSDWVGRIVSTDMRSALVVASLLEKDVDLQQVAQDLEAIRTKYGSDKVDIHIIGFAKVVGDVLEGATGVVEFFGIAFVITAVLLYWYCRSAMLTATALVCALVPVVWLLGLLPVLGMGLDPMSILVPFLIFSIGVSHAVQMTNAWKLERLRGADGVTASRNSFQKLFIPGAMALLANALGFLVIALVDIGIVRELTLTATLGVTIMILTNKLLLPIMLSFLRHPGGTERPEGKERVADRLWQRIGPLASRRQGKYAIAVAACLLVLGVWKAHDLKIGDLGKGVPELRAESRYNRDVEMITSNFAIGVDQLQVIAEASGDDSPCVDRKVMDKVEAFEFSMRQLDEVVSVRGIVGFVKAVTQGYGESNLKWRILPEETAQIAQGVGYARGLGAEMTNAKCSAFPITIYTRDHQATTIDRIIQAVKTFKAGQDDDKVRFLLAAGNVGVMAATNEAVAAADKWVNSALFASVVLLCLATFRSLRVTLCIVIPLAIVTVLCNALMVMLGIGVKVNTLPVVALGAGVGVDYGIYLFERMKHEMRERNHTLQDAFQIALNERGTASVFTAVTMTVSVVTWAFSALKFQADMGILLAFMFIVNLLGAILLLPALAAFLIGDRRGKGS